MLPFVTEEVWSWWRDGSVHRSPWPEGGPLRAATGVEGPSPLALETAAAVLAEIRRAKTAARVSLRARWRVGVADRPERLAVWPRWPPTCAGPATSTWPCSTPPTP